MEIREFNTFVKKGVKPCFDDNDYVLGRISGMMDAICNPENEPAFATYHIPEGTGLTVECTQEQYDKFTKMVEKNYPGLCEFDFKGFE